METEGIALADGRRAGERIVVAGRWFDGLVCASDLVAVGLMQSLGREDGWRIPEDVLVTGYNDNAFASTAPVPLTTVTQPRAEMSALAADLLLEHIDNPTKPAEMKVLKPKLVTRASSIRFRDP